MTDRIVITRRPRGTALAALQQHGTVWLWPENHPIPRQALLEQVDTADGLYSMLTEAIDRELLDSAPALRAISTMAAGVDNIDVAACTERGIPVGHTLDVLTESTADTAFALLLLAARRFVEGVDFVRAGRWQTWDPNLLLGSDIHSSVLGIIGLGRIGKAVARRARGFDMEVLYTGRHRHPAAEAELGAEFRDLSTLLAQSDHVVVTSALTDETHHLMDAAALSQMKRSATLVNIARGELVDPTALYEALQRGTIAAAALDVTEPEPLPGDHPLLSLPNCVVIPHLGSATERTREAMAELAADNLIAGLRGERMPAVVNPEVYDR